MMSYGFFLLITVYSGHIRKTKRKESWRFYGSCQIIKTLYFNEVFFHCSAASDELEITKEISMNKIKGDDQFDLELGCVYNHKTPKLKF